MWRYSTVLCIILVQDYEYIFLTSMMIWCTQMAYYLKTNLQRSLEIRVWKKYGISKSQMCRKPTIHKRPKSSYVELSSVFLHWSKKSANILNQRYLFCWISYSDQFQIQSNSDGFLFNRNTSIAFCSMPRTLRSTTAPSQQRSRRPLKLWPHTMPTLSVNRRKRMSASRRRECAGWWWDSNLRLKTGLMSGCCNCFVILLSGWRWRGIP